MPAVGVLGPVAFGLMNGLGVLGKGLEQSSRSTMTLPFISSGAFCRYMSSEDSARFQEGDKQTKFDRILWV
jgi:hypothetical protein